MHQRKGVKRILYKRGLRNESFLATAGDLVEEFVLLQHYTDQSEEQADSGSNSNYQI